MVFKSLKMRLKVCSENILQCIKDISFWYFVLIILLHTLRPILSDFKTLVIWKIFYINLRKKHKEFCAPNVWATLLFPSFSLGFFLLFPQLFNFPFICHESALRLRHPQSHKIIDLSQSALSLGSIRI